MSASASASPRRRCDSGGDMPLPLSSSVDESAVLAAKIDEADASFVKVDDVDASFESPPLTNSLALPPSSSSPPPSSHRVAIHKSAKSTLPSTLFLDNTQSPIKTPVVLHPFPSKSDVSTPVSTAPTSSSSAPQPTSASSTANNENNNNNTSHNLDKQHEKTMNKLKKKGQQYNDAIAARHEILAELELTKKHKKLHEQGILLFNSSPSKGIQFIVKHKLVEDTSAAIAHWLFSTDGLDKKQVGDYLGAHHHENVHVMYEYVNLFDFHNLTITCALRLFLSYFRLPGEAQQIDRLVEKFSEQYCKHNTSVFLHLDHAYLLSYSLIMLNTDAHSPKIIHKMTMKQFVRNSSGLLQYGISKEYLEECYRDIKEKEFSVNYSYLEQLYSRVQVHRLNTVKLTQRRRATSLPIGVVTTSKVEGRHLATMSEEKHNTLSASEVPDNTTTNNNTKDEGKDQARADNNSSPVSDDDDDVSQSFFDLRLVSHLNRLSSGHTFIKYCFNHSSSHPRRVWLSEDCRRLFYQDVKGKGKRKEIELCNVIDVVVGRDSSKVLESYHLNQACDFLCFSIITTTRTLDFQAESERDKEIVMLFVNYLTTIAESNRFHFYQKSKVKYHQEKENNIIKNLEDWKRYIPSLSRTSNNKNKTNQLPNAKLSKSIWKRFIPPSLRSQIWYEAIGNHLQISTQMIDSFLQLARYNHSILIASTDLNANNNTPSHSHTRSRAFFGQQHSLDQLFTDLRETFPYLKFFHDLEQTPAPSSTTSTETHTPCAPTSNPSSSTSSSSSSPLFTAQNNSTLLSDPNFTNLLLWQNSQMNLKQASLREILEIFILYRPDISYIQSMSYIAAVLLLYFDFYDSFILFCNLLNSPFFNAFCRMDLRQLEWRFAYFNNLVSSTLPNLSKHFKSLDLEITHFFSDWVRPLYAKFLSLELSTRVWDLYLLEGEIVVYRVAIALLRYHESELLRCTYADCVYLLTEQSQDIDESAFWTLVEQVEKNDVDVAKFSKLLAQNSK